MTVFLNPCFYCQVECSMVGTSPKILRSCHFLAIYRPVIWSHMVFIINFRGIFSNTLHSNTLTHHTGLMHRIMKYKCWTFFSSLVLLTLCSLFCDQSNIEWIHILHILHIISQPCVDLSIFRYVPGNQSVLLIHDLFILQW